MQARKSLVVASAAAILTVGAAGCSIDSNDNAKSKDSVVTVVGNGEVKGAPDILTANIGVTTTAPGVSDAVNTLNDRAKAMLDAIAAEGVAKTDVQTTQLSVQPEFNNPAPGGSQTITGYRATNTVKITVRDMSKASAILDKAVKAGGDSARLNGISFSIADDSQLLSQARERAFNDAKTQADQYAKLADVKLGKVLSINEGSSVSPRTTEYTPRAEPSKTFAIEPGQQTISFTVTVQWKLN